VPDSTYSGDPKDSELDATRFLVRDTSEPFTFTDAEVDWALGEKGNPYLAGALLAWRMYQQTLEAAGTEKQVGDLRIARRDTGTSSVNWGTLARQLEREGVMYGAAPVANPNALGAGFSVGEMDHRRTRDFRRGGL